MEMNSRELADFFGVHAQTVGQWVRQGLPVKERGRGGRGHIFDSIDVMTWRDKHLSGDEERLTAEEAKLKKLTAEAKQAEMNLMIKQGILVPMDDIERKLSSQFAYLNQSMRTLPGRVVMQLVGETNEIKIKDILLDEIDDTLERVMEMEIEPEGEDDAVES